MNLTPTPTPTPTPNPNRNPNPNPRQVGATYRRAWARARGALLLLLLGCAHVTVALQLAATLRGGAPLDARAQVLFSTSPHTSPTPTLSSNNMQSLQPQP